MKLRQNYKTHLKVLEFTLITTTIFIVGWWYFNFDSDYLKVIGIFQLINTLPSIYLHIEYTIKNWDETIVINEGGIEIIKSGISKRYSKDKLQKIILNKPASLDKGGIRLTSIESYYYFRILTIDGEEIIITCLMDLNIEDAIIKVKNIPRERVKKLFCSIDVI